MEEERGDPQLREEVGAGVGSEHVEERHVRVDQLGERIEIPGQLQERPVPLDDGPEGTTRGRGLCPLGLERRRPETDELEAVP